jgi:protein tyrosine phosphatase
MSITEKNASIDAPLNRELVAMRVETPEAEPRVPVVHLHAVGGAQCGLTEKQVEQLVARTAVASEARTVPIQKLEETSSLPSQDVFHEEYSKFVADKNWRLCDFAKIRAPLADGDYAGADKLQRKIQELTKLDPAFLSKKLQDRYQETEDVKAEEEGKLPWNATYDDNRVGFVERVGQKTVLLNWTDLRMPLHRYFAGGCPHTREGVSVLFKHIFAEKCPVIVSLHQPGSETSDRIGEFWKQDILKQIPLPDGWSWSFDDFSSRVLETAPLPDIKTLTQPKKKPRASAAPEEPRRTPQIVESLLVAKRGEEKFEIRHYHHDGWVDRNPMPSLRLFLVLMNLVMKMNVPSGTPIAVNCRGGVGRTGIFVGIHYLLLQLVDQLKKGVSLENVQLNIMDMMYQLRVQRRIFLEGKRHLCDVLECLSEVYEVIKKVGVPSFLAETNLFG